MATFKAVVRRQQLNKKGESNIKIRIVQHGKSADLKTDHYIKPGFMGTNGHVKATHPNAAFLNVFIDGEILKHQKRLLKLDDGGRNLSAKQIRDLLQTSEANTLNFFAYAEERLNELEKQGKATVETYRNSINQFKDFVGNDFLLFKDIDKKLLEKFEGESLKGGRSINTIGVYMRSIRSIFNDAIEEFNHEDMEPVITNYPFRYYKIKTENTRKRSLDAEIIRKIKNAELTDKLEIISRDTFMLIFYLIGINMKDLFYLRKLSGDRIEYKRFKTHTPYSIKVEPEAMAIIKRYKGEKYLLRFADHCKEERGEEPRKKHVRKEDEYLDYKAFMKRVNIKLKDIATALKISEPVSTYYARHSWATIARNDLGISKDDISLCLGHRDPSKRVTDIYLKEDQGKIDAANRKVIDLISSPSSR